MKNRLFTVLSFFLLLGIISCKKESTVNSLFFITNNFKINSLGFELNYYWR